MGNSVDIISDAISVAAHHKSLAEGYSGEVFEGKDAAGVVDDIRSNLKKGDLLDLRAACAYVRAARGRLEYPPTPRGLTNVGHHCYRSAVMQCVFHDPDLRRASAVAHAPTRRLFEHMANGVDPVPIDVLAEFIAATSAEFLKAATTEESKKIADTWSSRTTQQDAAEFLQAYYNVTQIAPEFGKYTTLLLSSTKQCIVHDQSPWPSGKPAPVGPLFIVQIHDARIFSLLDAMYIYGAPEILSGGSAPFCEWSTTVPKRKCPHYRTQRVEKWPPVLIVHLQRFSNERQRIHKKIVIPLAIERDELPWAGHAAPGENFSRYELNAAVASNGNTPKLGHYWAYVRNPPTASGTWYKCDDMAVTKEKTSDIPGRLAESGYLLFYRAMGTRSI
jgi:ubiquitin C-terminal hydrolase